MVVDFSKRVNIMVPNLRGWLLFLRTVSGVPFSWIEKRSFSVLGDTASRRTPRRIVYIVVILDGSSCQIESIDARAVRGCVLITMVEICQRRMMDSIDNIYNAISDGNA